MAFDNVNCVASGCDDATAACTAVRDRYGRL
jgi:hypothetical protein